MPWSTGLKDRTERTDNDLAIEVTAMAWNLRPGQTELRRRRNRRAGAVPARQLNHHVRAGRVRYVIIGNGPKRPRHMLAESDLICGEQCSNWEH
jgi:hypothetical protein